MDVKAKKSISLALSAVMLTVGALSISACFGDDEKTIDADVALYSEGMEYVTTEKGTPSKYASLTFDYLGGSDVMPIGGFYGPSSYSGGSVDGNELKDLLSEEVFSAISDAGVNMIVYNRDMWLTGGDNQIANKVLDLCEAYGIGNFMQLQYVEEQLGGKTSPYPVENMELKTQAGVNKLQSILDELTQNGERECVIGLHGRDEPFTHEVKNLSVFQDVFYNQLENNYGLTIFGNSLGYWTNEWNMFGYCEPITFKDYMNNYLQGANPSMLSFTQYIYGGDKPQPEANVDRNLFDLLAVYRQYAIDEEKPFWRMLQAGGQQNDSASWIPSTAPYPNEGETLFDVNMSLAYGAKAIQYFPLVQPMYYAYAPDYTYDFERCGLIGANGNLTRWYYYAKRANEQIQAVDEYLMHAASEGIIVHGETAYESIITKRRYADICNPYLVEGKFRQLIDIAGDDCVIGCFDYKGGTALYVVNYSRKEKADVTLKFNDKYRYNVIQRAVSCDVVGTAIPLTLDAGEGALIVLK